MLKRRIENSERQQIDSLTSDMPNKISVQRVQEKNESLGRDSDGNKVIVRKFNFPLPPRNIVQPTILRSQLSFCAPKEKWKYQHDVPDGKIVTKRVYREPNSTNNNCVKSETSSVINSQGSKLFLKTPQCETVKQLPTTNKSFLIVPANEQTSKVLAPIKKTIGTDKITVNNLPENVIPNSIKVVDAQIVNGKKVYYLKAFKEVGKVGQKHMKNGSPEATVLSSSVDQNVNDNQVVKPVSESESVKSPPGDNSGESTTVLTVSGSSSNNLDHTIHDSLVCQLASANDSGTKTMLNVTKSLLNSEQLRKLDSVVGKPLTIVHSNVTSQLNVVSDDRKTAISLPCDIGEKKNENKMNSATLEINRFSNVKCYSRTSVRSQNKSDIPVVKQYNVVSSGKSTPMNVLQDIGKRGKEITLQIRDGISKLRGTIINSDVSKLIAEKKNVIPHVNINRISEDIILPVNHILQVNEPTKNDDQLKLVPADSTTSFISTSVGSTIPVESLEKNAIALEAEIVIHREGRRNSTEEMADVTKPNGNINSVETIVTMNNKPKIAGENVFVLNQHSLDSNTVVIPKQTPKFDDIMRKRNIALQYQRDVHKTRYMPRAEKIVELPARKVKLADTSTQTTLFSMLEPGRMVEMLVNEDLDGGSTLKPTKAKNSECKSLLKKNRNHKEEATGNISFSVCDDPLKLSANKETNKETMDAPFSKRMRLDINNSATEPNRDITASDTLNETYGVSFSMDTSDLEQMQFQSLEKENFIELNNITMPTKSLKSNENEIRNINYPAPLSSMQSVMNCNYENSAMNSGTNQLYNTIIDRRMMLTLFKDYRSSLVPDNDGNLPIHNAVMDKDLKQVQRLCLVLTALKETVDVRNRMKETPLQLAVLCHDLPIINLLLKYNAKTDVSDSEGNTALHMAIKWTDNRNILDMLLEFTEDNSPALNVPNDEGYSLLHLCALQNKGYEALKLIKKNANINIRDRKSGRTPLFHAVESGNKELSCMLVNSGASTTIPNFSGQTPLNASEVTLVFDQISEHPSVSHKVVPCSCQTPERLDSEQSMSHSKTHTELQRDVNIEELCVTEVNMSEDSDLLNYNFAQAFHDR